MLNHVRSRRKIKYSRILFQFIGQTCFVMSFSFFSFMFFALLFAFINIFLCCSFFNSYEIKGCTIDSLEVFR